MNHLLNRLDALAALEIAGRLREILLLLNPAISHLLLVVSSLEKLLAILVL